jgi:hypothetical protein
VSRSLCPDTGDASCSNCFVFVVHNICSVMVQVWNDKVVTTRETDLVDLLVQAVQRLALHVPLILPPSGVIQ